MSKRKSHAPTVYLVRRDNLPTINFTLRDNERPAIGYYLDPSDPKTWRPVDTTGKNLTGWFRKMCGNREILFGIPVLRHAPLEEGRCTLLGSPSTLMNIAPGWYEVEIESHTCATSYIQTVWKRFKFCVRDDFDSTETDGMNAPIFRDADGVLQELPISPPFCVPEEKYYYRVSKGTTTYTLNGTAQDVDGTIDRVEFRLNGGAWFQASTFITIPGSINWTAIVTGLLTGENMIEVRSIDDGGACSTIEDCYIYREVNLAPTVSPQCPTNAAGEEPSECFEGVERGQLILGDNIP